MDKTFSLKVVIALLVLALASCYHARAAKAAPSACSGRLMPVTYAPFRLSMDPKGSAFRMLAVGQGGQPFRTGKYISVVVSLPAEDGRSSSEEFLVEHPDTDGCAALAMFPIGGVYTGMIQSNSGVIRVGVEQIKDWVEWPTQSGDFYFRPAR